jgi:hypothetical protein
MVVKDYFTIYLTIFWTGSTSHEHLLFLLVVDLPNWNGSDFPKPVGNTAIQYFLSIRHSRIVLCYCFNSSMPNSGKISVEALSIISHGGCHGFFLHNTDDTEKAVLWLVVLLIICGKDSNNMQNIKLLLPFVRKCFFSQILSHNYQYLIKIRSTHLFPIFWVARV